MLNWAQIYLIWVLTWIGLVLVPLRCSSQTFKFRNFEWELCSYIAFLIICVVSSVTAKDENVLMGNILKNKKKRISFHKIFLTKCSNERALLSTSFPSVLNSPWWFISSVPVIGLNCQECKREMKKFRLPFKVATNCLNIDNAQNVWQMKRKRTQPSVSC